MRRFLLASSLAAAVSGCASIMHGTTQEVGLASSPTGADVVVDNKPVGKTPSFTKLARKDNHIVKITMDGYQPFEMTLTRSVSGWVWGNLVFGGIPGLAVDAITGGLYKLSPEQVAGTLAKVAEGPVYQKGALAVVVVMWPDPSWQCIGALERTAP